MRLVTEHLPAEYEVTGDVDAWPLIAAALLSRMTTTIRMLLALQWWQRSADPGTLLRSLYEHMVHLAWLGADPSPTRFAAWRREDLRIRVAAAKEAEAFGIELVAPAELAAIEAQVANLQAEAMAIPALTREADLYWVGRLPGLQQGSLPSFAGLYTFLYRRLSGTAHPSFRGINPVVVDITETRKRVVLEARFDGNGPWGMATIIYGMALFVVNASLGWPDLDRINAAFDR